MAQLVLLLCAFAAVALSQGTCDYRRTQNCINAQVSASTTVSFTQLFTSPPKLVFAIDDLESVEIEDQKKMDSLSVPFNYKGPLQRVAWWLEYDNSTLTRERTPERTYSLITLETNATNAIGGSDGGCQGLLGDQCIKNLRDAIAWSTVAGRSLDAVFQDFYQRPLRNLSCALDIFGNSPYDFPATLSRKWRPSLTWLRVLG